MLRMKLLGSRELARDLRSANAERPSLIEGAVQKAAEVIIGAAKKQFKGERTRARYMIKGGRPVLRRPPRPVTSPPDMLGVFTGSYRLHITAAFSKSGRKIRAEVGPEGIPYARIHEFGGITRGGARMPKRPVLTPAVDKSAETTFRLIGQAFKVV